MREIFKQLLQTFFKPGFDGGVINKPGLVFTYYAEVLGVRHFFGVFLADYFMVSYFSLSYRIPCINWQIKFIPK